MFKKSKVNKNKLINADKIESELQLHEEDDKQIEIDRIKNEIDSKNKKPRNKGLIMKMEKEDGEIKDDNKISSIKKQFFSETLLQQTKDPEDIKKLLGVKREEIEQLKEDRKKKALEVQKELYTMPESLKVAPSTKNDYVETILKLSDAGLIEVPTQMGEKFKQISEVTNPQNIVDPKLAEELDYLNVLKKYGTSYGKYFKPDISKKQIPKLNKMFGDAFAEVNSRKRKLMREKQMYENQINEEF
jgi:hypothetical protein